MTEWEKFKVSELKEELKSRGIPLTGLKLKQQLIDKLIEIESGVAAEKEVDSDSKQQDAPQPDTTVATRDAVVIETQSSEQPVTSDDSNHMNNTLINEGGEDDTVVEVSGSANITQLSNDVNTVTSDKVVEVREPEEEDAIISEQDTEMKDSDDVQDRRDLDEDGNKNGDLLKACDEISQNDGTVLPMSEAQGIMTDSRNVDPADITAISSKIPTPEMLEDQRKRKRRSVSPAPDTQEIQKKAKMNDGEAAVTKRESEALEAIQAATDKIQDGRAPNDPDEEPVRPMEASDDPDRTRVAEEVGGLPDASELYNPIPKDEIMMPQAEDEDVITPEPDYYVTSSIHPATASIYIRNFKRPLHIPTLRSHISSVAKSSSDPEADVIKVFYLDVIRTHAFVSFTSISAASRVRNAMHETRFPDEPMREPLWIDFIPDEKVQIWIDQETGSTNGSFGGGRSSGRKYEVVYENTREGVEVILRDPSESHISSTFQQQRSSRISQDHTNAESTPAGIHPDRSGLVPTLGRDWDRNHPARVSQAKPPPINPKSDSGKGFQALDELFSSTTTKPKLYYKPVSQSVVDSRLDMIQELTTGYSDTGRSGDGGMKRYTFEEYRGREEWVDKGPEFGFGRKGQDRLEGFRGRARGAGGFRGRGRGGDSWRGGR